MNSGVVCLRNLKTDRVYLFYAEDIQSECARMRFELDLGLHGCKSLQEDYENTGLEVFRFDTLLETSDKNELARLSKVFDNQYV